MTRSRRLPIAVSLLALVTLACTCGLLSRIPGFGDEETPVPIPERIETLAPEFLPTEFQDLPIPTGFPEIPTGLPGLGGERPEDVPVIEPNEDLFGSEAIVSYTTDTPFEDALAFYQEQMEAHGWEEASDPLTVGGVALLTYEKESRSALITISATDDDKTSVQILIGETGE